MEILDKNNIRVCFIYSRCVSVSQGGVLLVGDKPSPTQLNYAFSNGFQVGYNLYPYLVWLNRSSPLHSAEAAFRRLGFSHLGTLRQGDFRFNNHRAGETVGIFAGAALLRMQYICCRYPQM